MGLQATAVNLLDHRIAVKLTSVRSEEVSRLLSANQRFSTDPRFFWLKDRESHVNQQALTQMVRNTQKAELQSQILGWGDGRLLKRQSSRSKSAVFANDWQPHVICRWTFLSPRHLQMDFPVLEVESEILFRAVGLLSGLDISRGKTVPSLQTIRCPSQCSILLTDLL